MITNPTQILFPKTFFVGFSLLVLMLLTVTAAAQHIPGVTAKATSYQANFDPNRVTSDSGLTETAPGSGVFYLASNAPQWNSNYNVIGGMNDDRPIIDFDLGASYTVNRFHVWNFNAPNYTWRGFNDVSILYSQDGVTWKMVAQRFRFAVAPGNDTYAGEDHVFNYPVTARYIRFQADSAHRTWSDVTGLGRVRFYAGGTATEPPPSTSIYPRDAGVVNVKEAPYFAKGDGVTDDTDAIQRAITDAQGSRFTVYLPAGTYLVSRSLRYRTGIFYGNNNFRGENRASTILKLANNTLTDAANPRAVLFLGFNGGETGGGVSADWFNNNVSDLTIDTGTGNAGAIGLQFYSNNVGAARNLTIRSGDRQGVRGLDLGFQDQNGPLLAQNIAVEGFDYGVWTGASVNSQTLEHITVSNQRVLGFRNEGQCLSIRDFKSTNSVPAFHNVWGVVALVDAVLNGTGGSGQLAAITNGESIFARNIQTSNYQMAIDNQYQVPNATADHLEPNVTEYVSTPVNSLFESPARSLNLPVKETPDAAPSNPNGWANVRSYRRLTDPDDTAAIQRAIDSGAATVYFPTGGTYFVGGTVLVRGNVIRLIGMYSRVVLYGTSAPGFLVENAANQPAQLFVEKFSTNGALVTNVSSRNLIVKDSETVVNSTGTGEIYFDNVVGGPFKFTKQNVWARQLNVENQGTKIANDNAQLWILGLKTERGGTLIETINGGRSELIGGLSYTTGSSGDAPMFVNNNSQVSATIGEVSYSSTPFTKLVSETRAGETRFLNRGEGLLRWSFLGGSAIPLYIGYPTTRGSGGISFEIWNNVGGNSVGNIPYNVAPTATGILTSMETPVHTMDNYGTRLRGYLTAPATGAYTFWISGDDNCELWLSTDETAANKIKISSVPGWTNPREWTKYAEQRSATVNLAAGQRYYIEALQKEGWGGDHVSVGWTKPGENVGATPSEIVPGAQLSPFTNPSGTTFLINLITNAGFEAGNAFWSDWGNASAVAQEPASGANSIKVGAYGGGRGQSVAAVENTAYTFGGAAKVSATGEKGWIGVNFLDAWDNQIAPQAIIEFTETNYTNKQITFTTPPGTVRLRAWIWKDQGINGYFYADDLRLVKN